MKRQCPTCSEVFDRGQVFCEADGTCLIEYVPPDPMLGKTIDERYLLKKPVGGGGMGQVYLAEDKLIGRGCALKLMKKEIVGDPLSLQRFQREARAASLVAHPHIVHIYDFGQTTDGLAYLVMEFLQGVNLRQYQIANDTRMVPLTQALDLTLQIAQALAHAHKHGVVHRGL